MSGIVGSLNTRGSGLINLGSATDGQLFTGTGAGLPVGFETAAGGGKVLQVVSVNKTDIFTSNSPTAWEDVTGMAAAITCAATSSKVLLTVSFAYVGSSANNTHFRIMRDTTAIAIGDARGSRQGAFVASITFLDSPGSTDALDYQLQVGGTDDTATMYINKEHTDNDGYEHSTYCSTVTLMEIGA